MAIFATPNNITEGTKETLPYTNNIYTLNNMNYYTNHKCANILGNSKANDS